MGRRLNRERSWVQTVVPTPIAQSVIGAVVACAEAENITEVCVFGQPVTGVVTYQAQTVEAPQSPVRTYRGAPLES